MTGTRRIALYWIPPIAWAVTIWILMGQPGDPEDSEMLFPHFDKLAHLGAFFLLAALLFLAFRGTTRLGVGTCGLIIVLLVSLFGGLGEWHQLSVPHRSADLADWIFDTAGGLLAWPAFLIATRNGEPAWLRSKNA